MPVSNVIDSIRDNLRISFKFLNIVFPFPIATGLTSKINSSIKFSLIKEESNEAPP